MKRVSVLFAVFSAGAWTNRFVTELRRKRPTLTVEHCSFNGLGANGKPAIHVDEDGNVTLSHLHFRDNPYMKVS